MLLYQQIRHYIFSLIEQTPQMKKLPSERELVEKFTSTRITVREALMRLESEGLIYRLNRKGWFICPPRLRWDPVNKANFYQLAREQAFIADTQLVSFSAVQGTGELAEVFKTGNQTEELFEICRVRCLDERPVMLEEIYCRAQQFKQLEQQPLDGSITTIFRETYAVDVVRESSHIYVTALPQSKAPHLQLNSGASCLKIIRHRYAQNNVLVDYNIEYWVHGAIEIKVESH